MTGVEIGKTVAGIMEQYHMSVETSVYFFLEEMGKIIDEFNSEHGEITEAREHLKELGEECKVFIQEAKEGYW